MWFLSYQHFGLAKAQTASNFFDGQVRSWLDGTWAMPARILGAEAIRSTTGLQMYFGPFPSLLRLPILLVTNRLDGRLTQPSILTAYLVYLGAGSWLWWQVRTVVTGNNHPSRRDLLHGTCAVIMVGVGSIYLTLLAGAVVYLEAIAWGTALAMLSFACVVSCLRCYRTSTAIAAILSTTGAALTRITVGGGALVAIWLTGIVWAMSRASQARIGTSARVARHIVHRLVPTLRATVVTTRQCVLWLSGATVATAAYMAVNFARFGTLASIPWGRYVYNTVSAHRTRALDANGGTLTGLKFLPTTLWNYFRPDGVTLESRIPWITFPRRGVTPVGNVVLDVAAPTSSFTAVMPLFLLLAVIGVVAVFRRKRANDVGVGLFRVPLIGAFSAIVPFMLAGFLAHRYMADALPFFIIAAFVGFHTTWQKLVSHPRQMRRHLFTLFVAILALWGVAANVALTVETQNVVWPRNDSVRYDFVRRQYRTQHGGVRSVDYVPPATRLGDLLVVGDCEALLWSSGFHWVVLEGEVTKERWTREPWMKYFDLTIPKTKSGRDTVLCRQLQQK